MILMIATVCLLSDPVTLTCKTEVLRMEKTPIACLMLVQPMTDFLIEQAAGMPGVQVLVACKAGMVV
jgi:hypothetical protein